MVILERACAQCQAQIERPGIRGSIVTAGGDGRPDDRQLYHRQYFARDAYEFLRNRIYANSRGDVASGTAGACGS